MPTGPPGAPLVAVITPTWQRPFQLARAMLSVAAQDYRPIRHVVVSDGPDPLFRSAQFGQFCRQLERRRAGYQVVCRELPDHDPEAWWGRRAKLRGQELASAPLTAWLDDDDTWRPDHIPLLVQALSAHPGAGFAFSRQLDGDPRRVFASREEENAAQGGPDYPHPGHNPNLNTVLHRSELMTVATWRHSLLDGWDVLNRWLEAGTRWAFVDQVTVDSYLHDFTGRPGDGYPPVNGELPDYDHETLNEDDQRWRT